MNDKELIRGNDGSVSRRDFIKTGLAGAAALGATYLGMQKNAFAQVPEHYSAWKWWGKTHFKGVENETLPSFTEDFRFLSEAGIRLDVQQAIRHGFVSTLCTAEAGVTFQEAKDFVEIVADEGKGKIFVSTTILFDTFDQCFQMLEHAAAVGCSHVLLGYPASFYPESETEIFDRGKEMIETANIGIILYPTNTFGFGRFDSLGFPRQVLQDLAELPNVFACKAFDGALFEECYNRFGSHVLVSTPNHTNIATLVKDYGMQWIGAGAYECFQSPEKPYFVDMVNLYLEGKEAEANVIFDLIKPVSDNLGWIQGMTAMLGTYHWGMHKYFQWCTGGNGGYVRQPCMKLYDPIKSQIRSNFESLGITPSSPEKMFYVGRSNWNG